MQFWSEIIKVWCETTPIILSLTVKQWDLATMRLVPLMHFCHLSVPPPLTPAMCMVLVSHMETQDSTSGHLQLLWIEMEVMSPVTATALVKILPTSNLLWLSHHLWERITSVMLVMKCSWLVRLASRLTLCGMGLTVFAVTILCGSTSSCHSPQLTISRWGCAEMKSVKTLPLK